MLPRVDDLEVVVSKGFRGAAVVARGHGRRLVAAAGLQAASHNGDSPARGAATPVKSTSRLSGRQPPDERESI